MKVFFNVKSYYRTRHKHNIENLPESITAVHPVKEFTPNPKILNRYENKKKVTIPNLARWLGPPNLKKVKDPKAMECNLIYSPGAIILNDKPYVLEVDNVACLTYYNPRSLKNPLTSLILKHYLKKDNCRKLVCMSEAAKKSVENTFKDAEINSKLEVVYPPLPKLDAKRSRNGKKTRFLYVSTHFYSKGGREILKAFERVSNSRDDVELVIVSRTPESVVKKYSRLKNVTFKYSNLSFEELQQEFVDADVFVLPTYWESFGMAVLEAMNAGLAVLSTDLFALPELVEDGKNGFLTECPVPYYNKDFTPNPGLWFNKPVDDRPYGETTDTIEYVMEHEFPEIEEWLVEKINLLASDEKLLKKMKAHSKKLTTTGKFSLSTRRKNQERVFKEALNGV